MSRNAKESNRPKVLAIFGTRPEAIKLAPVIRAIRVRTSIDLKILSTMQQAGLLPSLLKNFSLVPDYQLDSMVPGQSVNQLLVRLIAAIEPIIETQSPAAVMVQGDTTSCLAGALAARMQGVEVIHVEAGLRTGHPDNPFPEELNRKLVAQLASLHCAATEGNRAALLKEGHSDSDIVVTGNPVVDAINWLGAREIASAQVAGIISKTASKRVLILTAHRRESFGAYMDANLGILRQFIDQHPDFALVFPVHPNPAVGDAAARILRGNPRIYLINPLDYEDFIQLCRSAWLIVSDSGGLQEEAASLGKPLLVLRAVTERPEAIACGIARLIGPDPTRLRQELSRALSDESWVHEARQVDNPFGDGRSGERIADAVCRFLDARSP